MVHRAAHAASRTTSESGWKHVTDGPTGIAVQQEPDMSRYESLGLLANPFDGVSEPTEPAITCETLAAGNRLLGALYAASFEDAPRPIRVIKDADIPSSYSLAAGAHAEHSLAVDETLNILHAYIQLFMFKNGVMRGTLGVLAERLAFRDIVKTLVPFVREAFAQPDESLPSWTALGPEQAAVFVERFDADPESALVAVLGEQEVERHEELIEVLDPRRGDLEDDGDEEDVTQEIDETVGDAPGTAVLLAASAQIDDENRAVLDYLVEYTRVHLSPVLARGLRMYRERGLSALSEELKITKAPRKTAGKLAQLATMRFRKIALLYDEFGNWPEIPADLRSQIVGSLTRLRWKLDGQAVMVLMLANGEAPELEEALSGGSTVDWTFKNVYTIQEHPNAINEAVVNDWIASATVPGTTPATLADSAYRRLVSESGGDVLRFITLAHAAVELAANRRATAIGDEDVDAALAAVSEG